MKYAYRNSEGALKDIEADDPEALRHVKKVGVEFNLSEEIIDKITSGKDLTTLEIEELQKNITLPENDLKELKKLQEELPKQIVKLSKYELETLTEDDLNSHDFQGKINGISTTLESMLNILKKADGPLKQIMTSTKSTIHPNMNVYYDEDPFHEDVNDNLKKLQDGVSNTHKVALANIDFDNREKNLNQLLAIEQEVIKESMEIIKPNVDQQQDKAVDQQQQVIKESIEIIKPNVDQQHNLQEDINGQEDIPKQFIQGQFIQEQRPKTNWENFTAWIKKIVERIWPGNRQENNAPQNLNTNQVVNGQENHEPAKNLTEQQQAEVTKQKNQYQTGVDDIIIDDPKIMNLFSQLSTEKNSQSNTILRDHENNYIQQRSHLMGSFLLAPLQKSKFLVNLMAHLTFNS